MVGRLVSFWGPACFQGRLLLVSGSIYNLNSERLTFRQQQKKLDRINRNVGKNNPFIQGMSASKGLFNIKNTKDPHTYTFPPVYCVHVFLFWAVRTTLQLPKKISGTLATVLPSYEPRWFSSHRH